MTHFEPITDETITGVATDRWATAHSPRTAQLMTSLVRHIHQFARETSLTEEEWTTAINWLTETGKISSDKRQEFILASDVIGLSMLVVQLNHQFDERATPATVLGPFHIEDSPVLEHGADMSDGIAGTPLYVHGTVFDLDGNPLPDVVLDVWQADADGNYESQLEIDEARLRALYRTNQKGQYCVRSIVPLGYSIPMDGPVGKLISATDISHFRPAHIHFLIDHPGFKRLITHLFAAGTEYLDSDVVFGTKLALVVEFRQQNPGPTPDGSHSEVPFVTAEYDFRIQPNSAVTA